jgi:hypothetical protein
MAGYTRNDSLNNIADGNIINAADLDGEFDALVAAFHALLVTCMMALQPTVPLSLRLVLLKMSL